MADLSAAVATNPRVVEPRRSRWLTFVRNFARKTPLGAFGAAIVIAFGLVAVFAPMFMPHDPYLSVPGARLTAPSLSHPMGTDELARDVLSRVVLGARISLYVGVAGVVLGTGGGLIIGLFSGYIGGLFDTITQRIMDILLAFPGLIFALALVAMLGNSLRNVILAVAIGAIPSTVRVVRASVLAAKAEDYVLAAQVIGASPIRIALRQVLPNVLAPVIILGSVTFGSAIIIESSLSFLGLGIQPPEPSWGAMLSGPARRYMLDAPWLAIGPGVALTLVVFGVNVFGDGLRDVLDPRMKR